MYRVFQTAVVALIVLAFVVPAMSCKETVQVAVTPSPTQALVLKPTPVPTETATPVVTPTPKATQGLVNTNTPSPTPLLTSTPVPSLTPLATAQTHGGGGGGGGGGGAPQPTQTVTPSPIFTPSPTPTPIPSPSASPSPTPSPTPTTTTVPTPEPELFHAVGQIGGLTQTVMVEGNYAYVGVGPRVVVLDVSSPSTPYEVGATPPFEGFVTDIAVVDNRAYVACGGAGLYVVDVLNPAQPIVVGVYDSPGYAEGVVIADGVAYVADGWAGLRVINISDPIHPKEVGLAHTLGYAFDVKISDSYAYVAAAGAGLRVVYIEDSSTLPEVASLDTPGYARDIAIAGDIAYVADQWKGLRIVDISDPLRPAEVGFYQTPGQAFGVTVSDSEVYVADAFSGIRAIDVSDRGAFVEIGAYEVKGHAGQISVSGNIAYVADSNYGLRCVDVADPTRMKQVGFYTPFGYARNVAVDTSHAYVAAGYYGMHLIDITNKSHLLSLGAYDTVGYSISVYVAEGYAYLATLSPGLSGGDGLEVVDISNAANPKQVAFYQRTGVGAYRDMTVVGDIAYMANEVGLEAISLVDPTHPVFWGFIPLTDITLPGTVCSAVGIAVNGNFAYVCVEQDGLKIVDISDPSNMQLVAVLDLNFSQDVAIVDKYAYVADNSGLQIIDVSDPYHPVSVGYLKTAGNACGIAVAEQVAYLADAGGGLNKIDVSDPSNPVLIETQDTLGYAHDIAVVGDYVLLADGHGGLLLFGAPQNYTYEANNQSQTMLNEYKTSVKISQGGITTGQKMKQVNDDRYLPAYYEGIESGIGNTFIVSNAADNGPGSLRWCLENAGTGDRIIFDSSVFVPDKPLSIYLKTPLPAIQQGYLTIDASEAGVILDGTDVEQPSTNPPCLAINSDNNVVKGLAIVNFPNNGIVLNGKNNTIGGNRNKGSGPQGEGNLVNSNHESGIVIWGYGAVGNVIIGNLIGTDVSGKKEVGNWGAGVFVIEGASNNIIGGLDSGEVNIISGNHGEGINLMGREVASNSIIGNYIGTNIEGTTNIGNYRAGVTIQCGAFNNLVQNNLISGNGRGGIIISDWGSSYNTVIGNLIGTDASGTIAIGNEWCGVFVGYMGASFNRIGGATAVERNVISGNPDGIFLGGSCDVGNLVMGNYIGTDKTGTEIIGNIDNGINIAANSERVFIGGMGEGEKNIISGNNNGISLTGSGIEYNWISGNYIGSDAGGKIALGNKQFGILLFNCAKKNIIQANSIQGSGETGIHISYESDNNMIFQNNMIQNDRNGFDDMGINSWFFCGEGNYWSDYKGKDMNGDGIGDTPYQIPSNGVDNYPLMEPY